MFKNIVVKNFRCFGRLLLQPLERVNLIAGKNNTGKTALLEAIHLHCHPGDCVLPMQINMVRGIQEPSNDVADVCGWLFWGKHSVGGLEVSSQDTGGVTRSLTMWILDPATTQERFPGEEERLGFRTDIRDANLPRLVLKFEEPNQQPVVSIGLGRNGRFLSISGRIGWNAPSIFIGSGVPASDADVEFFGKLEVAKRQNEIIPALQVLEPRLQRLSLVPLAGKAVIHGDVGLDLLVPVAFMGEGMRRLLSILLAISNASGPVLIDEIENGFHHSVMTRVWKAIAQASRRADVQIFATTHSYQCIESAHEAFTNAGIYDLRLHRLDPIDDEIRVVTYDQETLAAAMKFFMEVR